MSAAKISDMFKIEAKEGVFEAVLYLQLHMHESILLHCILNKKYYTALQKVDKSPILCIQLLCRPMRCHGYGLQTISV